jgi:hypothetical protein
LQVRPTFGVLVEKHGLFPSNHIDLDVDFDN